MKNPQPDSYNIAQKLFIRDKNKLLVFRDQRTGKLDFPGGRIDDNEFNIPLKACLMREVREEAGDGLELEINMRPVALFRHTIQTDSQKGQRVFLIGYEAIYQGGKIKLSDEHSEYFWQDIAQIKELKPQFWPGVWEGVEEYLKTHNI